MGSVVDPKLPVPDPDPTFQMVTGSGSGVRQKFRIHADPDPQHWIYESCSKYFFRDIVEGYVICTNGKRPHRAGAASFVFSQIRDTCLTLTLAKTPFRLANQ
jgi:hypothetical protein